MHHVADGFDQARRCPEADGCAEPEQGAGARCHGALDRTAQGIGDARRNCLEKGVDQRNPRLRLPKGPCNCGSDNAEGKEDDQRQIGKIARMDKAFAIDTDENALRHLPHLLWGVEMREPAGLAFTMQRRTMRTGLW